MSISGCLSFSRRDSKAKGDLTAGHRKTLTACSFTCLVVGALGSLLDCWLEHTHMASLCSLPLWEESTGFLIA